MSFYSFLVEYKWVILFYSVIILLIYFNRKKFVFQGKIIGLYRTKFGLRFMDYVAKRFNKTVIFFGKISIFVGILGFLFVSYAIIRILISLFTKPDVVAISPILPGVPIAGTGLVFPLIKGLLALLVIIVVHEFAHGVVARAYNLKILSSGFAFFGPIPGAFVEPDEKQIKKQKALVQNSIYAAGPFANILLTGIVVLLIIFAIPFFAGMLPPSQGIIIDPIAGLPAEKAGLEKGDVLVEVNNVSITDAEKFFNTTANLKPGDQVILKTETKAFVFNATSNPNNESKGYMGIIIKNEYWKNPYHNFYNSVILWIVELLFWIGFIGINVGLINLYPIFITDGARMLLTSVSLYIKDKAKANRIWININKIALMLFFAIILVQIYNWII